MINSKLWVFNPTGELQIANGTHSYQPPMLLQQFEANLSSLPMFMASTGDYLLSSKELTSSFLHFWKKHNITTPQVLIDGHEIPTDLQLASLSPWCWSNAMHHRLRAYKKYCSAQFCAEPQASWLPDSKQMYSRATALQLLKTLLQKTTNIPLLAEQYLPVICHNVEQIDAQLGIWPAVVLKSPWSSSGRGVQMLRHGQLDSSRKQWVRSVLAQQGYIMVEPLLDKQMDFGMQFNVHRGQVSFVGNSFFCTNSNGSYQSNMLGYMPALSNEQRQFWEQYSHSLQQSLQQLLEQSQIAKQYNGNLGVDAIMYKRSDGSLAFQPIIEINLRQTMGSLSVGLEQRMAVGKRAEFCLYFDKKVPFSEFAEYQMRKMPPVSEGQHWQSGFFPLSDSDGAFGAYIRFAN